MENQPNTHWDSEKFDDLIERGLATSNLAEKLQYFKQALLLAEIEAPRAETAGKTRIETVYPELPPPPGSTVETKSSTINLRNLRRALEEEGVLTAEDSPEEKHWDSEEFDVFIDSSLVAKDVTEELQWLKKAYLLAKREAPHGAITVGKFRLEYIWEKLPPNWINAKGPIGAKGYKINLEGLRRALKEHGLLDDEDSSE